MATRKIELYDDEECSLRVIQVRRGLTKKENGTFQRPRIIKETVEKWYYRCQRCHLWFKPTQGKQRFCSSLCRHSSFRENRKRELEGLRKAAGKRR